MIFDNLPEAVKSRLSSTSPAQPLTEKELVISANHAESPEVCPNCGGLGIVLDVDEQGRKTGRTCVCEIKRRNQARIYRSGLGDMAARYTFEAWQTPEPWQAALLDLCRDYAQHPCGWLCLAGRPGTGKTHLCAAVCSALMDQGLELRYFLWREGAARIKAIVNDAQQYKAEVDLLKTVPVLYLDDFFKTGRGRPTEGDINLAFEIINARYNNASLLTIISSELTASELLTVDEAVGSRIVERTRGHYVDLSSRPNYRLRGEA